jgi:glycosyltransferase involved in cell wall biosynthesis
MTENILAVTVVVPGKNEEINLPRCLDRLSRFKEVIVVDSASADRTVEIARERGAKVLQFGWNGQYPKKRNWVLLNQRFSTEWVLFLDADEFVTDAFCDEVARAVTSGAYDGFWLNYRNYFLGQELRHGVTQRKLALFKVGKGLYERIDEQAWSPLDMEIHEHPIIEGATGEISTRIDHRDDRGIAKFLERHRDYAVWEANRILLLERQSSKSAQLTSRQRFKYANIENWWYPWFYFVYTYIVKLGFLDGSAGFYYSFYKAWYFLSIRLLVRDLRQGRGRTLAQIGGAPMAME